MSRRPSVPADWGRARDALALRVLGTDPERVRRTAAGEQARRDFTPSAAAVGELRWTAVLQLADVVLPVTEWSTQHWGTDPATVIRAAFAAALGRARTDGMTLRTAGPGRYRTDRPEHPALLLRPEIAARMVGGRLAVVGAPVLLVPTAHTALLAGADDPDALASIVALAEQELAASPLDAVSASPLRWAGRWEPFTWPTSTDVRRPDRAAVTRLTTGVDRLARRFADALTAVRDSTRQYGPPVRRLLGVSTTDEDVLTGWHDLATALGADPSVAAATRSAARDQPAWFDAHEAEVGASFAGAPDRLTFGPEHVLVAALHAAGALVEVSGDSDPRLIARDLAAVPVVRSAGLSPVPAQNCSGAMDLAQAISGELSRAGLTVVSLGDGGDALWLVPVPPGRGAEVAAAVRRIGDATVATFL